LLGQAVAPRAGLVGVDAARHHRTEPLAHVALLEARPLGELLARRRTFCGSLEQAGRVAELDHLREHRAGVELQQLPPELHAGSLILSCRNCSTMISSRRRAAASRWRRRSARRPGTAGSGTVS